MKLAICIPNTGIIKAQTTFCLIRALKHFPYEYDVIFKEGSILHANRESLVKKALELKATHILFLDTDMYFEKDAITKLIKRNKDIIGANYHLRKLPSTSILKFSKPIDLTGKKLVRCDAVATGFMLINTKVFKDMKHPYFFWESDKEGGVLVGEDYWFCRKARELGFDVWADLTIPVGHIGDYIY